MTRAEHTATITPKPSATVCDQVGCSTTELLALVEPDGTTESGVFCPTHRVEFLRGVSDR